ncbi:MAG: helix-turn-helix transcriptional regulator [Clostridia bacterium]|nr:helix-turn-helix transcriptional regulator [Clostridia bacterium]
MEDVRYLPITKLQIEKVSFVSVTRNGNYIFDVKKGKEFYSLVYIESGASEYNFSGGFGRFTLNKGELFFAPKNIPYKATYLKDNTRIKMICFDAPKENLFNNRPFISKSVEIAREFSEINRERMQDYLYLCSAIYRLLYILSYNEVTTPKRFKKILPAIKEIEANYFENYPVSHYAKIADMCESNFRRLFKEYTGKGVIEYRNEIRIREVNKMLISGEYNVNEAAFAAGFNNMSFFYEVYRKYEQGKK